MLIPTKEKLMEQGALALEKLLLVVIVAVLAYIAIKIIERLLRKLFDWTQFDKTLEEFVYRSVVTFLWFVTTGSILVILGINLNAILASFGIIGFIIGFALRDTLSNFAAGLMILLNKPFIVGDVIEVKGIKGKVRSVSMSNTRLVTEDNNKVMLPNSFIWNNPVINYTAYKKKE